VDLGHRRAGDRADGHSEPAYYRGAWFWRPATDDITTPVVHTVVNGTLGTQDWYRSDVAVSWEVSDPDSAVTFDCPPATVTADTAGTTFTCSAVSGGGTTTVSTTVKRDTVHDLRRRPPGRHPRR
jgi:hypothetical protein